MESVKVEIGESNSDQVSLPRIGEEYQAELPDLITHNTTTDIARMSPVLFPRIGEEYQAKLPELITHNSNTDAATEALDITIPFPGMQASTWKQSEKDMFLVGLYIFGKRLNLVRRFLEGKNMGDMLSYYYGEFYKSDGYKKYKAKPRLVGTRIFSGRRKNEIFSRLMESVPSGSHGQLQEIIKKYDKEESSFEDFIFALKHVTGTHCLVEAIGIHKVKSDLTRVRSKPTRGRNQTKICSEIPVGKGWSALSLKEIMQFLTGSARLGKARLNDIFWEAVWPRLLVRGWTSHKRTDHDLLFLAPGIDNLTKGYLIKGIHYFNSVTDLLSKVASKPELIQLSEEVPFGVVAHKDETKTGSFPLKFTIINSRVIRGDSALHDLNGHFNHVGISQNDSTATDTEHANSKPKQKDGLAPMPKRRKGCQIKKARGHENDENAPCGSHGNGTNQETCSKELLTKEELKPVADTENEGLYGTTGRRHGMRSRLSTSKVLESIALDHLSTSQCEK